MTLTVCTTPKLSGHRSAPDPPRTLTRRRWRRRRRRRGGLGRSEDYVPIREVVDRPPLFETTQTWIEYKTLPITAANERLVSLIARHPDARIDRNHNDYLRAANGDVVFTG